MGWGRLPLATKCLLILSLGLYVGSFGLPAIGPIMMHGRDSLGYGVFTGGLVYCWALPCWWANPAAWIATVCLLAGKAQRAVVWASVGLVLALSTIAWPLIGAFNELLIGYWTWTTSIAVLLCAAFDMRYTLMSSGSQAPLKSPIPEIDIPRSTTHNSADGGDPNSS